MTDNPQNNHFTFAIITDWEDEDRIKEICNNIKSHAGLRPYEILIIGGGARLFFVPDPNVKLICGENEWITTKKNVAAYLARYENLVMMHDYFLMEPYWFEGWEEFGFDWDVCSCPQSLMDGNRHFTDWVVWDSPKYPRYHSLDYWDTSQTRHQYISGGYFVVKRRVMMEEPLNVNIPKGHAEDVEWSLRVRSKYKIACNPYSRVIHNKKHRDMR